MTASIRMLSARSRPDSLRLTARLYPLRNGTAHLARDLAQPGQPLLERRVRGEQRRGPLLDARRDDEERVHRLDLTQIALRDPEHLARDLLQRAHQVLGRAGDQRRAAVGGELAVARDREDQDL